MVAGVEAIADLTHLEQADRFNNHKGIFQRHVVVALGAVVTLEAVVHQGPIAHQVAVAVHLVAVVVTAVAVQADIIKINIVKTYFAVLLLIREDFFYVCQ